MRGISRFATVLAVLAALFVPASPALASELTISAAASLTDAFKELKPLFEKANPGTTLTFNFAASGPLLKQIESGAPVDVFASADQQTMDLAAAKKLIAEATRTDFAANALVMIVPADSTLGLAAPADLKKPQVERLAVGNPDSVPVGRYTRQALSGDGLYDALKAKMVLGESVRQVLDYVARGEVQAGFVYLTDALVAGDKVKVAANVAGHKPITYPVAAVAASGKHDEAGRFIAFLNTTQGRAVLAKYGFAAP